jgi:hypothetical protein
VQLALPLLTTLRWHSCLVVHTHAPAPSLRSRARLCSAAPSATLTLSRPVHGIASVGIKGLPLPLARTAHRQPSTSSKRLLLPYFPPLSRRHHRQLTTAAVLPHLHALEELPVEAYLTGPVTQHLFHRSSTAPLSRRRSRRCAAPARCHLLSVRTQAQDIVRQVRHRPWVIAKNTFSSAGLTAHGPQGPGRPTTIREGQAGHFRPQARPRAGKSAQGRFWEFKISFPFSRLFQI